MEKKIRIACVGAGYFARFHVEAWQRIPEVELVAICDRNLSKANALAGEFGVDRVYDRLDDLLAKEHLHAVDIITPPESHLTLYSKVAELGLDCICQKPFAPTLEEADQIQSLARKHAVRLMVHENFRFQPWYRQAKALLESGAIGSQVHSIYFRMRTGDGWPENAYLDRQPYFRTMPRLLIYETGVHFIDIFRYLLGEVSGVFANLRKLNANIAGEDCATVIFTFENGARGILDASRYHESNAEDPRYTFGSMLLEGSGGGIRLSPDGNLTLKPLGKPEMPIEYQHEDRGFGADCVYATQRHFIDCLLGDLPFETSAEDYLRNLAVQEAVYASARETTFVPVSYKS